MFITMLLCIPCHPPFGVWLCDLHQAITPTCAHTVYPASAVHSSHCVLVVVGWCMLLSDMQPPGGASFSTYENTHMKMIYKNTEESQLDHVTWSASGELAIGFETEASIVPEIVTLAVAAPMGAGLATGVSMNLPNSKMEARGNIAPKFETSGSAFTAGYSNSDSEQENELTITFTYSTSADPVKAGPPSDVFLVRNNTHFGNKYCVCVDLCWRCSLHASVSNSLVFFTHECGECREQSNEQAQQSSR